MDPAPGGRRVFVSLRGSIPLSGDPHALRVRRLN
jgi:hypothetical protein